MTMTEVKCPTCGKILDGHGIVKKIGGAPPVSMTPKEGSISLCIYCATASIFEKDPSDEFSHRLRLKPLSEEGLQEIEKECPDSAKAIRIILKVLRKFNPQIHEKLKAEPA